MTLWIPAHQELAHHPKVKRVARALNIPKAQVIGHLLMLWWWALSYAPDGGPLDVEDIADAADWDGPATELVSVLVRYGFLDDVDGYHIHDWDEYAGRAVAARKARRVDGGRGNHIRWHVNEGRVSADCPWCSGGESGGDREANRIAEQRRAEEKEITASGPSYPQLMGVAERIVDERIAEGYEVKHRDKLVSSIARSEEAKHRWFKEQEKR